MTDIAAWTTEHNDLIVWGTHDPELAHAAADAAYRNDYGFTPDDEEYQLGVPPVEFLAEQTKYWADGNLDEEETWTSDRFGEEHREGRIPVLIVSLG